MSRPLTSLSSFMLSPMSTWPRQLHSADIQQRGRPHDDEARQPLVAERISISWTSHLARLVAATAARISADAFGSIVHVLWRSSPYAGRRSCNFIPRQQTAIRAPQRQ